MTTTLATAAARLAGCAILGLGLAGGAAAAPGAGAGEARRPGIDCRCRAGGRTYELGERACLGTPTGFRIAECRMVQNVTSWSVREEGCAVSALAPFPAPPVGARGDGRPWRGRAAD